MSGIGRRIQSNEGPPSRQEIPRTLLEHASNVRLAVWPGHREGSSYRVRTLFGEPSTNDANDAGRDRGASSIGGELLPQVGKFLSDKEPPPRAAVADQRIVGGEEHRFDVRLNEG